MSCVGGELSAVGAEVTVRRHLDWFRLILRRQGRASLLLVDGVARVSEERSAGPEIEQLQLMQRLNLVLPLVERLDGGGFVGNLQILLVLRVGRLIANLTQIDH